LKRQSRKAENSEAAKPARRVRLSHVALVLAGMGVMWAAQLAWRSGSLPAAHAETSDAGGTRRANAPWGELQYTSLALDRPEEYFTNELGGPLSTVWVFRNHSEQQVEALLSSLRFKRAVLASLKDRQHWRIRERDIQVAPPASTVLELGDARPQLYSILAQDPGNVLHANVFRFRRGGFDEWFADCGLSADKLALVRKLAYDDGSSLCFADAAVFSQLASSDETRKLLKCLWRVPTLVMTLRLDERSDVAALAKYWGVFGSGKTYQPLLESMSRVAGGSSLNVSYFLPPFARTRLYTYPHPRDPQVMRQDCFWTAMNFFNTTPDDGFFQPDYTQRVLARDYARVRDGTRQFGDVLLLLRKDQQALHMCVYLADDVVFTKNGANTQQPWVLMKLPHMLGEYEKDKPFDIVTYRRINAPPMSGTNQMLSATAVP
jgi:hypothetical protein